MLIVPLVVRKRIDVGAGGLEMLNPLLNFLCYAFTLLLAFIMINVWSEQVNKMQTFAVSYKMPFSNPASATTMS